MNNVKFMLEKADKIVIGLSGGADSVALTHILCSEYTAKKLICVHVNHGIRGDEASRDEQFTVDFCKKLGVEVHVVHADVKQIAKEQGISEEECGRNIRYSEFNKLVGENGVIATAHNADDNAETVLMNLVRGTGIKGMCGIPPIRGNIVRPILNLSRDNIEKYCAENGLNYVIDSTNLTNDYSRNKVRNLIFPLLKEINNSAIENINRSSSIFDETYYFIENIAKNTLKNVSDKYGIDTEKLNRYDEFTIKQVVSQYLKEKAIFNAEQKHIDELYKIIRNKSGAVVLPSNKKISISQNILSINTPKTQEDITILLENEVEYMGKLLSIKKITEFYVNNDKFLFTSLIDCDKIKNDISVGKRREAERFTAVKRNTKTLKKLFNEAKIPVFNRDDIAIIRDGDEIVYIEGFGVDKKYMVTDKTKNVAQIIISKGE